MDFVAMFTSYIIILLRFFPRNFIELFNLCYGIFFALLFSSICFSLGPSKFFFVRFLFFSLLFGAMCEFQLLLCTLFFCVSRLFALENFTFYSYLLFFCLLFQRQIEYWNNGQQQQLGIFSRNTTRLICYASNVVVPPPIFISSFHFFFQTNYLYICFSLFMFIYSLVIYASTWFYDKFESHVFLRQKIQ